MIRFSGTITVLARDEEVINCGKNIVNELIMKININMSKLITRDNQKIEEVEEFTRVGNVFNTNRKVRKKFYSEYVKLN